jgi:hypothetical protein
VRSSARIAFSASIAPVFDVFHSEIPDIGPSDSARTPD